jgi:hypothetical protein
MRVSIVVQDDAGNVFRGEMVLSPEGDVSSPAGPTATLPDKPTPSRSLDFELPVRAFIKRYAGSKTGAQRFAILIGRLAKGDLNAEVSAIDLEHQWNSMTALMGGEYNRAYPTRAKERGWVDSPKRGIFKLLPGWLEAIGEDASAE